MASASTTLLSSLISALGQPLASSLASGSSAIQAIENYITSIEANLDNPQSVARFAQDIAQVPGAGVNTQLLADKIIQLAQTTPYNPAMVMSEIQGLQALLAQTKQSIFARIGLAQTTTP